MYQKTKQQEEVVMAKPEQKQEQSAMEIASILAKLIVDVEQLQVKVVTLAKKMEMLLGQVMILCTFTTDAETKQRLVKDMMSHEDFIEYVSEDETPFDEVWEVMRSQPTMFGDLSDSDKERMKATFGEVKDMFTIARHELDLSNDEQQLSELEEE